MLYYWVYKPGEHWDWYEEDVAFVVSVLLCYVKVVSEMCRQPVWAAVTFVDGLDCPLGMIMCQEK